jgi:hypothetical protein
MLPGDPVTIIYCPSNPEINCEIRYFLHNPHLRLSFKRSGKLELLEKFNYDYWIGDYSIKEWYRQETEK